METGTKTEELPNYLINPGHKITVAVVGVGGTGSWLLGDLVALDLYLRATNRPGLSVTVYDPDIVTEANIGRQNFTELDLGESKAIALIEKYNLTHGLNWEAKPQKFDNVDYNIVISCVDSVASRREIANMYCEKGDRNPNLRTEDLWRKYLWIDCGNGYDYGQVIVTPLYTKKKKNGTVKIFGAKTFFDYFPNAVENTEEASCSVLESLNKQNLFINKFIANLACNWLYEAIRTTGYSNLGYMFNFNGLTPLYL